MSDLLQEVLKHRYVYVPHRQVKDSLALGKRLGLAVARSQRVPLTVLSPRKSDVTQHAELNKLTIVTERSGYIADGGVVLVWCPRFKTMEKLHHLESSTIVLVEWVPGEMEPWAKVTGAYNVATGVVMDAGLSAEAEKALEGIVYEGYKGWTDDISARGVFRHLKDLLAAGAYDRALVLAYARLTMWERAIERLEKILDKFEAASHEPRPVRGTGE
ncbi:hypothetical protein ACWZJV_05260 [Nocardioides sp. WG-D5]